MELTERPGRAADGAPPLPATLRDPARGLLADERELLFELADGVGGPYHLVFPECFDAAAGAFAGVLRRAGVGGRVVYAKKANKASCWVRRCAELGIGVDVASPGELTGALAGGVRGEALVVTGPAKSAELTRLAILHGSLLTVDALDELEAVAALAARLGPARILLRCLAPATASRFGLGDEELGAALRRCAERTASIRLEGFSFHLTGYEATPRADLAARLLDWCERARSLGMGANVIDIGGGFAVDYVDGEDWSSFADRLADEQFHGGRGFARYYPYHSPLAGAEMLRAVLEAVPSGAAQPLQALLRAAGVQLLCEPGRALLDQGGCTVVGVRGVKAREYGIVAVDATSLSLSEQWFASEFLPDPVLLTRRPRAPGAAAGPFAACVGGASCLESDMLSWRKVRLPARPRAGDLLVYVNTAGYQMDSNESSFHDLALPPKIVVERGPGAARWRFDEHPGREGRSA